MCNVRTTKHTNPICKASEESALAQSTGSEFGLTLLLKSELARRGVVCSTTTTFAPRKSKGTLVTVLPVASPSKGVFLTVKTPSEENI